MLKIIRQQIEWNEETNKLSLVTKYSNGSITSEPITSEEAAQWTAENKF